MEIYYEDDTNVKIAIISPEDLDSNLLQYLSLVKSGFISLNPKLEKTMRKVDIMKTDIAIREDENKIYIYWRDSKSNILVTDRERYWESYYFTDFFEQHGIYDFEPVR
jgi:hypothetical protein